MSTVSFFISKANSGHTRINALAFIEMCQSQFEPLSPNPSPSQCAPLLMQDKMLIRRFPQSNICLSSNNNLKIGKLTWYSHHYMKIEYQLFVIPTIYQFLLCSPSRLSLLEEKFAIQKVRSPTIYICSDDKNVCQLN